MRACMWNKKQEKEELKMKIKLFDKVLLKNGKTAHIVEIYEHGKAYEADILVDDSGEYLDYETETIRPEDIDKIIK